MSTSWSIPTARSCPPRSTRRRRRSAWAASFLHFWLAERSDVYAPVTNAAVTGNRTPPLSAAAAGDGADALSTARRSRGNIAWSRSSPGPGQITTNDDGPVRQSGNARQTGLTTPTFRSCSPAGRQGGTMIIDRLVRHLRSSPAGNHLDRDPDRDPDPGRRAGVAGDLVPDRAVAASRRGAVHAVGLPDRVGRGRPRGSRLADKLIVQLSPISSTSTIGLLRRGIGCISRTNINAHLPPQLEPVDSRHGILRR